MRAPFVALEFKWGSAPFPVFPMRYHFSFSCHLPKVISLFYFVCPVWGVQIHYPTWIVPSRLLCEKCKTRRMMLLLFYPMIPSVFSSRLKTDSKDDWGRVSDLRQFLARRALSFYVDAYARAENRRQNYVLGKCRNTPSVLSAYRDAYVTRPQTQRLVCLWNYETKWHILV